MAELPGFKICPHTHSCCYGIECCPPNSCCNGNEGPNFGTCYVPPHDFCTEYVLNCVVLPYNTECSGQETPCGPNCCSANEYCNYNYITEQCECLQDLQ